jgi:WD40 repeat protein
LTTQPCLAIRGRKGRLGRQLSYATKVQFSPDGRRIVSGSDDNLRLWDTATGKRIGLPLQGQTSRVFSVAFSLDGKRIISGSDDNTLRLWDAGADAQKVGVWRPVGRPIATGQGIVRSLIELKNGEVMSGGRDGTLRSWRTTHGWQTLPPLACAKLERHHNLTSLPWLNSAGATCQHFVWRYRHLKVP